jgi:hypothetical protein
MIHAELELLRRLHFQEHRVAGEHRAELQRLAVEQLQELAGAV